MMKKLLGLITFVGLCGLVVDAHCDNTETVLLRLIYDSILNEYDLNLTNQNGETALMFCAMSGSQDLVKKLLEDKKVDVNKKNNAGKTALMLAQMHGHEAIVEMLQDAGAQKFTESEKDKKRLDD